MEIILALVVVIAVIIFGALHSMEMSVKEGRLMDYESKLYCGQCKI